MMSRVLALALGIALLAPACKTPLPAKRAAVRKIEPREPAEFLPNDLDFVVRIDAARLRKEPAIDEAARGFAKAGASNMLRAIVPSLARSSAISRSPFRGRLTTIDAAWLCGPSYVEATPLCRSTSGRVDSAWTPSSRGR